MTEGRYWSLGPIRARQIDRVAVRVVAGIEALLARQHDDGSWGSNHPLDRVVSTCHSTMLLLSLGTPASDTEVSRALTYLASPYVGSFQWGFWRLAPMLGVPGYEALVERDLGDIERHIETNAGPSPDQPLTTFAARAYQWLHEPEKAKPHIEAIIGAYRNETAWSGRADATSHALSAVLNSDQASSFSSDSLTRAINLIVLQANRHELGLVSWGGRVTSTAYVAMNVIETERLRTETRLRALLPSARDYLLSGQQQDNLWLVEPTPYGGDLEIVERDYYSAVALRGLVAICSFLNEDFLQQVYYILMSNTRTRGTSAISRLSTLEQEHARERREATLLRRFWQFSTIAALLLLLIPQALVRIPQLAASLGLVGGANSDVILGRYGSWASIIALVIAVAGGLISLIRWLRRKSPGDEPAGQELP